MVVPERIFVRAPNWVGDLVMATPAFARLRAAWPEARITLGLRGHLRGLVAGAAWFDELLDTPKARNLSDLRQRAAELRERRFDLAVLLPNSLETALVARLAGIPRRIGYRQGRPFLLTDGPRAVRNRRLWQRRGPRRVPEPMPQYYRRLLDVLDIPPGPERPTLPVEPADREAAAAFLARHGLDDGRRLVLFTAGAAFGASKLWLPERFAAVARHFAGRPDTAAVLLAGPAEVELIRGIAAAAPGAVAAVDPILPFGALKGLVERASLMVSTDTGPRHVAVALGVPVVCVMGPTDRRYTDYALDDQIVIQRELPCVPCQKKTCPLGHHDCMRKIEVDEVVAAAERLLG